MWVRCPCMYISFIFVQEKCRPCRQWFS
jgi:hypothetical protein